MIEELLKKTIEKEGNIENVVKKFEKNYEEAEAIFIKMTDEIENTSFPPGVFTILLEMFVGFSLTQYPLSTKLYLQKKLEELSMKE